MAPVGADLRSMLRDGLEAGSVMGLCDVPRTSPRLHFFGFIFYF